MIFSTCSRLARQSAIPRLPTTSLLASPCPRSSPSLLGQSTNLSRCAFSSSRPRARSRFAPAEAEDQSPFKRHRLEEFAKDEASEDRVLKSLYPRLESDPLRRSVGDFLEAFDQDIENSHARKVALTGRVRRIHPVGKHLLFLDIVNEFRKVQVMVNAKNLERNSSGMRMPAQRFKMFRHLIKVGDHISVTGHGVLSGSGARTLEAVQLPELLAPTMEQIPETLIDPKTRMQERHVDLLVNQEAVDFLRLRSAIMKHMRDYFHSKEFLEFQTPIIAEDAGGAVARPFVTKGTEFGDKDLALRVAPELWLKRLVVGGIEKVFEMGPAFRNEGIDATHNPEFTTCEFYSAYSNLDNLINETEELLCSLASHSQELISQNLTSLPPIDLSKFARPFKRVDFVPALEEAMGIRLPRLSSEDALPELLAVLKLSNIEISGETPTSLAKLLDRLAAQYLEPQSMEAPIFLMNQPACMSPLAKSFVCPTTLQLVSARAELFIGGRELANMYEEENDPWEQKRKLQAHRQLVNLPGGQVGFPPREDGQGAVPLDLDENGEASPLDQSFIKALDYGLPPTGGWGCGVERLVMLFSGANRISDCLSFGTLRHVVSTSSAEKEKQAANRSSSE